MTVTRELEFADFAAVVAATFGVPSAAIGRETSAADVDGWDSISQVRLIVAIEDAYGLVLDAEDIYELENVGALFDRTVELAEAQ